MSEENYKSLSGQLTELRKDMDAKITELRKDMDAKFAHLEEKMVTKGMLVAAVIIPLSGINLAFLAFAVGAIIQIAKN